MTTNIIHEPINQEPAKSLTFVPVTPAANERPSARRSAKLLFGAATPRGSLLIGGSIGWSRDK